MLHKDRKIFTDEKARELQEPVEKKDIGAIYKILCQLSGQFTQTMSYLRNTSGENILDQSQCLRQWEHHFEKLLNSDPPDKIEDQITAAADNAKPATDGTVFTAEEIKAAVRKLKNNKTQGVCGLTSELLKNGDPFITLWLQVLFNTVRRSEIITSD